MKLIEGGKCTLAGLFSLARSLSEEQFHVVTPPDPEDDAQLGLDQKAIIQCVASSAEDDLVDGYFVDSLIKSEIVKRYTQSQACAFFCCSHSFVTHCFL